MNITARPYRDEKDYFRIRTLLQEIYAIGGPPIYCSIGDLDWWRFKYEDPDAAIATAHLWEKSDGTLVGIAWPEESEVALFVHPHHRDLEDEMLAWADEWRIEKVKAESGRLELSAHSFATDEPRNAVLRRRGYERTDSYSHDRMRSLDEPILKLSPPAGYSIRHVRGEEDLHKRVTVHRDAFAPYTSMTPDKYRAIMNAPTYRPELDLVVEAPDGSFASSCIVWYDERNQLGVFEPVGCHPQYRRRGLTKALMVEALRRLKCLGAIMASVGAECNNVASNALYESLGFRTCDYNYLWKKSIR